MGLWFSARGAQAAGLSSWRRVWTPSSSRLKSTSARSKIDIWRGGGSLENVASELAQAKALAVSAERPHAYCIGADQTLTLEGKILHKSRDLAEGAQDLAALSGKTHRLTSAFCVARAGQALVVHRDHADLRMRALDPAEISRYLERAGPSVLSSVGVYQGESLGMHLFERIEGDHSVVLGLPMLSLLAWMRRENLISL